MISLKGILEDNKRIPRKKGQHRVLRLIQIYIPMRIQKELSKD